MLVYSGVTDAPEVLPETALLGPARPNPFNPMTTIHYALPRSSHVRLAVYDLQGRRVRTLVDEVRPAGGSVAEWDGRDDAGLGVSSGVYFCILETAGAHRAMKLTLLR